MSSARSPMNVIMWSVQLWTVGKLVQTANIGSWWKTGSTVAFQRSQWTGRNLQIRCTLCIQLCVRNQERAGKGVSTITNSIKPTWYLIKKVLQRWAIKSSSIACSTWGPDWQVCKSTFGITCSLNIHTGALIMPRETGCNICCFCCTWNFDSTQPTIKSCNTSIQHTVARLLLEVQCNFYQIIPFRRKFNSQLSTSIYSINASM